MIPETEGARIAREIRVKANQLTDAERKDLMLGFFDRFEEDTAYVYIKVEDRIVACEAPKKMFKSADVFERNQPFEVVDGKVIKLADASDYEMVKLPLSEEDKRKLKFILEKLDEKSK